MSVAAVKPKPKGAIGKDFERELRESIEHLWPALAGGRARIPDEKGQRRRYYGERRIADFAVPIPGGRTLYIEAKATAKPRWELRSLSAGQRDSLRALVQAEALAFVVVLFRTAPPYARQRCIAIPAAVAVEFADAQDLRALQLRDIGHTGPAQASFTVPDLRLDRECPEVPLLPVPGRRLWDLRVLLGGGEQ